MSHYVAPIVEGDTEEQSIKKLLSRVWSELLHSDQPLCVLEPAVIKRASVLKSSDSSLADAIESANRRFRPLLRQSEDRAFILLLIDTDEGCIKQMSSDVLV